MAVNELEVILVVGEKRRTNSPSAQGDKNVVEQCRQLGSPISVFFLHGHDYLRGLNPVGKSGSYYPTGTLHRVNELLDQSAATAIPRVYCELIGNNGRKKGCREERKEGRSKLDSLLLGSNRPKIDVGVQEVLHR